MSSTLPNANLPGHDFGAQVAIDGNIGNDGTWNFAMINVASADRVNPYLTVRIPPGSTVTKVEVYNRYDALRDRLANFRITVGTTTCADATAAPNAVMVEVVCASPLTGSSVTLTLPGTNRLLMVAELKVFGTAGLPAPSPPELPPGTCPVCGCSQQPDGSWVPN